MAMVQQAISVLKQAVAKSDPSSDLGQAILKSIESLGKHAPPQQAAPGPGNTALANIAEENKRNSMLQMLQRQQGAQGAAQAPA